MSHDPVDAATVMRLDSQIRDIAAFRRNASAATTRLSAEDTVLETIRELLNTAVEIAAGIASDDPADPKRHERRTSETRCGSRPSATADRRRTHE
jgi:flagellin-like hook-associated protein FlgL